jgi:hypothetical protein
MSDWETTRREFCRIAAKRGVVRTAEDVPANKMTLYRLISGETKMPSRAIRAGIERIVEEERRRAKGA